MLRNVQVQPESKTAMDGDPNETSPNCRMSEYADQLRSWLNQAYQYQYLSYLVSTCTPVNPYIQSQNVISQPPPPVRENQSPPREQREQQDPNADSNAGRVYRVPKLSKRLLAEIIDFGLLFMIKAIITLSILESWNTENLDLYDDENEGDVEYEFAMAVTANIMTIEVVHRILVVFYEVWFTMQGGTTPGKRTMGIRIISCNRSVQIAENTVMVTPGTDINFWKALSRAFLKNMGTAVLLPTYFPLMFVQQNRTLYDVMCGTIVVEM